MPEARIPESTISYVVNKGDRAFKGMWANQEYVIAPGATAVVPYFAMCSWFGDPRAVNIGDPDANFDSQHRTHAYRALSARYGTQNDSWYIDAMDVPPDAPAPTVSDIHWVSPQTNPHGRPAPVYYFDPDRGANGAWVHPNIPKVEVYRDGSLSDRIVTVLDDPHGDHLTPAATHSISEAKAIDDAVASLQQQVAQLQLEAAQKRQGLALDTDFADGVADAPPVVPDETVPEESPDDLVLPDESMAIGATSSGQAKSAPRPQRPRSRS